MATKKKRRTWIIIGLIALVVLLMAAAAFKAKGKPRGTAVTVEKAVKRDILETVSASGKIFPETEIKISSDVSGEIVELYVEEGDSIVAGQLLAKINPDTYVSAVERGEASLNNSRAQLAIARSSIESSIAQKEQIIAQLENARTIHQRNEKLFKDGVISSAEFDQSLANVKGLEANLRSSQASERSANESAKGAEYSVKSVYATLKELKTNLNRTTIKAPASGTISSLSIEQGERVVGTMQMTGTEMMRIANLNAMEVQVDVSENDILRVELGDEVDIEVDAYLDRTFKGYVTEIANSASNISGAQAALNSDQVTNFIVKVRLESESYRDLITEVSPYPFRPGMSATVDIQTEIRESVLSIPIQSVTTREKDEDEDKDGEEKRDTEEDELLEVVFIYSADTVGMKEVKTGIQDDKFIEILEGVAEDEEVISGPYSALSKKLESGAAVRIKEEKKKDDK